MNYITYNQYKKLINLTHNIYANVKERNDKYNKYVEMLIFMFELNKGSFKDILNFWIYHNKYFYRYDVHNYYSIYKKDILDDNLKIYKSYRQIERPEIFNERFHHIYLQLSELCEQCLMTCDQLFEKMILCDPQLFIEKYDHYILRNL